MRTVAEGGLNDLSASLAAARAFQIKEGAEKENQRNYANISQDGDVIISVKKF